MISGWKVGSVLRITNKRNSHLFRLAVPPLTLMWTLLGDIFCIGSTVSYRSGKKNMPPSSPSKLKILSKGNTNQT